MKTKNGEEINNRENNFRTGKQAQYLNLMENARI
jgi:hypothetical protein